MAEYCRAWGVDIAPHGKTTMAPQLWARQLAAGAWGITAATVGQARVMRAAGVGRVLIANEVVDPVAIAWVAEQLADPAFELLCYVDSDRAVDILERALRAAGADRPLPVLVELGFEGGRTGCRTIPEAVHVATRVSRLGTSSRSPACPATREPSVRTVRRSAWRALIAYLDRLRELTATLIDTGAFHDRGPHRRVGGRERVLRRGRRPPPRPLARRRGRARRAPFRLLPDA